MMRRCVLVVLAYAVVAGAGRLRAQDAPPPATLPLEIAQAMNDLTSDSFATRENAQHRLELMLAQDYRQLAARQEVAARLAPLTGAAVPQVASAEDALTLIDAQVGTLRFIEAALRMPRERQAALFKWAESENGRALASQAFAMQTDRRVAAAKELARSNSPEAAWALAQLINDDEHEVSLGAMDAAWDLKPTPELLDAIWAQATNTLALMTGRVRPRSQRSITVHGRLIIIYDQDNSTGYQQQDADIACELLVHLKDPTVARRLSEYIATVAGPAVEGTEYRTQQILLGYAGETRGMVKLIAAYKPREAVPPLMRVALSPNMRDWSTTTVNDKQYRHSSRVNAAALVLQIAGVDPKTFHLVDAANDGQWAIEGGEAEENACVDAMRTWWVAHAREYEQLAPSPAGK